MLRVSDGPATTEQHPGEGTLEWTALSTGHVLLQESPATEVSSSEDTPGLQV